MQTKTRGVDDTALVVMPLLRCTGITKANEPPHWLGPLCFVLDAALFSEQGARMINLSISQKSGWRILAGTRVPEGVVLFFLSLSSPPTSQEPGAKDGKVKKRDPARLMRWQVCIHHRDESS
jgi:hypothetical protein